MSIIAKAAPLMKGVAPLIIFGFAAHAIIAAVNMLTIPVYIRVIGLDGYGLIGLYFVLQDWTLIIDLGVGATVGRQLSRFRAGALSAQEAVSLFGVAEALFLLIGAVVGLAGLLSIKWVVDSWLGATHLPRSEVQIALRLALCLWLVRCINARYQIALIGLNRQIATNIVAIIGVLMRNGGSVWALLNISRSPETFFTIWLMSNVAEASANRWLLARAMPGGHFSSRLGWRLLSADFALAIGFTVSTIVGTLISQLDNIALSHTLPMAAFGEFSLVISICGGVALIVPPIAQACQPRLTLLLAQDRRVEFIEFYRLTKAIIIVAAFGLFGTIAAQPEMVIYAWTGNYDMANKLALTLTLFASGSALAAFLYVPFILQMAMGEIRLHVIGISIFGAFWIPLSIWSALTFGTVGAGFVWLAGNLIYLLIWLPIIYRVLLSSRERRGLNVNTWLRLLVLSLILAATRVLESWQFDRWVSLTLLVIISSGIMGFAAASSSDIRCYLAEMAGQYRRSQHNGSAAP